MKQKWMFFIFILTVFLFTTAFKSYAGMDLETGGAVSGIAVALNNYCAGNSEPAKALAQSVQLVAIGTIVVDTSENTAAKALVKEVNAAKAEAIPKSSYENVAISKVTDFVNIRKSASTAAEAVGKIYNNSAATILDTVDGEGGKWYKIRSGNVTGYMMARYFITGSEAEKAAQEAGTTYGTVNGTASLRLREKADMTSATLTLLANGATYQVIGQEGNFLKIQVDDDLVGYVFRDYIKTSISFTQAVSNAEEAAKKAEEQKRKAEAEAAISALEKMSKEATGTGSAKTTRAAETEKTKKAAETTETTAKKTAAAATHAEQTEKATTAAPAKKTTKAPAPAKKESGVTSARRSAIIAYAEQFLGNPYVYGGTSLTNGTDCSGFTMQIYEHFGIDIGRSSRDQAANGRTISQSEMKPGDLLFYASGDYINHVTMYIGNGKVIHASSSRTGIIESPADYRTPCKVVSFLN